MDESQITEDSPNEASFQLDSGTPIHTMQLKHDSIWGFAGEAPGPQLTRCLTKLWAATNYQAIWSCSSVAVGCFGRVDSPSSAIRTSTLPP
jgi:hypothetical protein